MPSVQISTPNSTVKRPRYVTHQRIYSKAVNPVTDPPGLDDDQILQFTNFLKSLKSVFRKFTGQNLYTGFAVNSFTTTTINVSEGYVVMDDGLLFFEGLAALTPNVAGYWGIIEFEFDEITDDNFAMDFWDTILNTPYQDFADTRHVFRLKLYDTYNTTAAFPGTTPGRTRWVEYKRAGVGGNIVEVRNVLTGITDLSAAQLGDINWKEAKLPPSLLFPYYDCTTPDEDLDAANWPDLVPYMREQIKLNIESAVGVFDTVFTISEASTGDTRAIYNFANTPGNQRFLNAVIEDILLRGGSYANGRCVTNTGVIGDQPTGDHAITFIDTVLRIMEVSGSGMLPATNVLMCLFEGAHLSTTFVDDSPSAKTPTFVGGDAYNSTNQIYAGRSSGEFNNGAGSSYATVGNDVDWDFGTGDFSIDCWYRPMTSMSGTQRFIFGRAPTNTSAPGATDYAISWNPSTNEVMWGSAGVTISTGTLSLLTPGAWNHISVVRNAGIVNIYVNGTLSGSAADVNNYSSSNPIFIMSLESDFNRGYLDKFRIDKGIARHTADFIPLETGTVECYPHRIPLQSSKARHWAWRAVYPSAPAGDPLVASALFKQDYERRHRHSIASDPGHYHWTGSINIFPGFGGGVGLAYANATLDTGVGGAPDGGHAGSVTRVDTATIGAVTWGDAIPLIADPAIRTGKNVEPRTIGLIPYRNGGIFVP